MLTVELVGNALCLDFTNTVNARPEPTRDWLASPAEAALWSAAVGRDLDVHAVSARQLGRARALRERLYGTFEPLTRGESPAPNDLHALVVDHAAGVSCAELRRAELRRAEGYRLEWPSDGSLNSLLAEVAASAVWLLTQAPLGRLGRCPSCGWLFLDTSKNGRRRWCSMASCGARDKARRNYRPRAAAQR